MKLSRTKIAKLLKTGNQSRKNIRQLRRNKSVAAKQSLSLNPDDMVFPERRKARSEHKRGPVNLRLKTLKRQRGGDLTPEEKAFTERVQAANDEAANEPLKVRRPDEALTEEGAKYKQSVENSKKELAMAENESKQNPKPSKIMEKVQENNRRKEEMESSDENRSPGDINEDEAIEKHLKEKAEKEAEAKEAEKTKNETNLNAASEKAGDIPEAAPAQPLGPENQSEPKQSGSEQSTVIKVITKFPTQAAQDANADLTKYNITNYYEFTIEKTVQSVEETLKAIKIQDKLPEAYESLPDIEDSIVFDPPADKLFIGNNTTPYTADKKDTLSETNPLIIIASGAVKLQLNNKISTNIETVSFPADAKIDDVIAKWKSQIGEDFLFFDKDKNTPVLIDYEGKHKGLSLKKVIGITGGKKTLYIRSKLYVFFQRILYGDLYYLIDMQYIRNLFDYLENSSEKAEYQDLIKFKDLPMKGVNATKNKTAKEWKEEDEIPEDEVLEEEGGGNQKKKGKMRSKLKKLLKIADKKIAEKKMAEQAGGAALAGGSCTDLVCTGPGMTGGANRFWREPAQREADTRFVGFPVPEMTPKIEQKKSTTKYQEALIGKNEEFFDDLFFLPGTKDVKEEGISELQAQIDTTILGQMREFLTNFMKCPEVGVNFGEDMLTDSGLNLIMANFLKEGTGFSDIWANNDVQAELKTQLNIILSRDPSNNEELPPIDDLTPDEQLKRSDEQLDAELYVFKLIAPKIVGDTSDKWQNKVQWNPAKKALELMDGITPLTTTKEDKVENFYMLLEKIKLYYEDNPNMKSTKMYDLDGDVIKPTQTSTTIKNWIKGTSTIPAGITRDENGLPVLTAKEDGIVIEYDGIIHNPIEVVNTFIANYKSFRVLASAEKKSQYQNYDQFIRRFVRLLENPDKVPSLETGLINEYIEQDLKIGDPSLIKEDNATQNKAVLQMIAFANFINMTLAIDLSKAKQKGGAVFGKPKEGEKGYIDPNLQVDIGDLKQVKENEEIVKNPTQGIENVTDTALAAAAVLGVQQLLVNAAVQAAAASAASAVKVALASAWTVSFGAAVGAMGMAGAVIATAGIGIVLVVAVAAIKAYLDRLAKRNIEFLEAVNEFLDLLQYMSMPIDKINQAYTMLIRNYPDPIYVSFLVYRLFEKNNVIRLRGLLNKPTTSKDEVDFYNVWQVVAQMDKKEPLTIDTAKEKSTLLAYRGLKAFRRGIRNTITPRFFADKGKIKKVIEKAQAELTAAVKAQPNLAGLQTSITSAIKYAIKTGQDQKTLLNKVEKSYIKNKKKLDPKGKIEKLVEKKKYTKIPQAISFLLAATDKTTDMELYKDWFVYFSMRYGIPDSMENVFADIKKHITALKEARGLLHAVIDDPTGKEKKDQVDNLKMKYYLNFISYLFLNAQTGTRIELFNDKNIMKKMNAFYQYIGAGDFSQSYKYVHPNGYIKRFFSQLRINFKVNDIDPNKVAEFPARKMDMKKMVDKYAENRMVVFEKSGNKKNELLYQIGDLIKNVEDVKEQLKLMEKYFSMIRCKEFTEDGEFVDIPDNLELIDPRIYDNITTIAGKMDTFQNLPIATMYSDLKIAKGMDKPSMLFKHFFEYQDKDKMRGGKSMQIDILKNFMATISQSIIPMADAYKNAIQMDNQAIRGEKDRIQREKDAAAARAEREAENAANAKLKKEAQEILEAAEDILEEWNRKEKAEPPEIIKNINKIKELLPRFAGKTEDDRAFKKLERNIKDDLVAVAPGGGQPAQVAAPATETSPVVASGEAPVVASGEAPVVASGETPVVASGETPVVAPGVAPVATQVGGAFTDADFTAIQKIVTGITKDTFEAKFKELEAYLVGKSIGSDQQEKLTEILLPLTKDLDDGYKKRLTEEITRVRVPSAPAPKPKELPSNRGNAAEALPTNFEEALPLPIKKKDESAEDAPAEDAPAEDSPAETAVVESTADVTGESTTGESTTGESAEATASAAVVVPTTSESTTDVPTGESATVAPTGESAAVAPAADMPTTSESAAVAPTTDVPTKEASTSESGTNTDAPVDPATIPVKIEAAEKLVAHAKELVESIPGNGEPAKKEEDKLAEAAARLANGSNGAMDQDELNRLKALIAKMQKDIDALNLIGNKAKEEDDEASIKAIMMGENAFAHKLKLLVNVPKWQQFKAIDDGGNSMEEYAVGMGMDAAMNSEDDLLARLHADHDDLLKAIQKINESGKVNSNSSIEDIKSLISSYTELEQSIKKYLKDFNEKDALEAKQNKKELVKTPKLVELEKGLEGIIKKKEDLQKVLKEKIEKDAQKDKNGDDSNNGDQNGDKDGKKDGDSKDDKNKDKNEKDLPPQEIEKLREDLKKTIKEFIAEPGAEGAPATATATATAAPATAAPAPAAPAPEPAKGGRKYTQKGGAPTAEEIKTKAQALLDALKPIKSQTKVEKFSEDGVVIQKEMASNDKILQAEIDSLKLERIIKDPTNKEVLKKFLEEKPESKAEPAVPETGTAEPAKGAAETGAAEKAPGAAEPAKGAAETGTAEPAKGAAEKAPGAEEKATGAAEPEKAVTAGGGKSHKRTRTKRSSDKRSSDKRSSDKHSGDKHSKKHKRSKKHRSKSKKWGGEPDNKAENDKFRKKVEKAGEKLPPEIHINIAEILDQTLAGADIDNSKIIEAMNKEKADSQKRTDAKIAENAKNNAAKNPQNSSPDAPAPAEPGAEGAAPAEPGAEGAAQGAEGAAPGAEGAVPGAEGAPPGAEGAPAPAAPGAPAPAPPGAPAPAAPAAAPGAPAPAAAPAAAVAPAPAAAAPAAPVKKGGKKGGEGTIEKNIAQLKVLLTELSKIAKECPSDNNYGVKLHQGINVIVNQIDMKLAELEKTKKKTGGPGSSKKEESSSKKSVDTGTNINQIINLQDKLRKIKYECKGTPYGTKLGEAIDKINNQLYKILVDQNEIAGAEAEKKEEEAKSKIEKARASESKRCRDISDEEMDGGADGDPPEEKPAVGNPPEGDPASAEAVKELGEATDELKTLGLSSSVEHEEPEPENKEETPEEENKEPEKGPEGENKEPEKEENATDLSGNQTATDLSGNQTATDLSGNQTATTSVDSGSIEPLPESPAEEKEKEAPKEENKEPEKGPEEKGPEEKAPAEEAPAEKATEEEAPKEKEEKKDGGFRSHRKHRSKKHRHSKKSHKKHRHSKKHRSLKKLAKKHKRKHTKKHSHL